ncbi:MAG: hypothetical protein ACFFCW_08810 [Candidatus Hodarchaeota archaeon]
MGISSPCVLKGDNINIYIGNLAREVTEEELRQEFTAFGEFIAGGELKVSNQMKLRTLYSLLAMGILVLIAGLTLVVLT